MKKFNTSSIAGKGKENEDYILCQHLSDEYLLAILADGMGGLSYGNEVAKIVAHSIADFISSNLYKCEPKELIYSAFEVADKLVCQKSYTLKCKMGAALCVALINNDFVYYAWQGNVRLYIVADNTLQCLTKDHVVTVANNNLLTRCINGKGFRDSIPIESIQITKGNKIYLCTDGYYQNGDIEQKTLPKDTIDDSSLIEISIE